MLDPRRYDPGLKTILGRTEAFTAESLAGWLAEQPATARFISSRIWRQQVGTPPKPQRLLELAAGWRQRQLSIPWLMAAIHNTPEASESRRQGLRLGDPLEVVARTLRLLGSRHPDALVIGVRAATAMGQAPFEPPSVKGWPVNEQWLNLRWLQENGSCGTDHGSASVALLLGDGLREPLIGSYPSLRELDGRGDLIACISPPDLYRQVL